MEDNLKYSVLNSRLVVILNRQRILWIPIHF